MSHDKSKDLSDDAPETVDLNILYKVIQKSMERMEIKFGEVHDRIDKMESSSQREQPFKAPKVDRRERNPPRNDYEDDYGIDLEEDDRMSNVSAGRFRLGMGVRGVRYGNIRDRFGNIGDSIMVKIRGQILLRRGGMMRIKKHHQRIHIPIGTIIRRQEDQRSI
ncbi:hypothetical protein Ddye_024072 [Dipteronia dyeriana]|uniref:Uncharacterized protein n=1 Tax=Dipteronia dyeriana TaxID=168575 RepID=A0AAD9TU52_9ROSI|nr:hypothetical protein Ddye_024072 [Dipteronia dyeriana]